MQFTCMICNEMVISSYSYIKVVHGAFCRSAWASAILGGKTRKAIEAALAPGICSIIKPEMVR